MLARLSLPVKPLKSRRMTPSYSGARIDARATIRAAEAGPGAEVLLAGAGEHIAGRRGRMRQHFAQFRRGLVEAHPQRLVFGRKALRDPIGKVLAGQCVEPAGELADDLRLLGLCRDARLR